MFASLLFKVATPVLTGLQQKATTWSFHLWHPMERWDSGVAPDVIGPGFVGNLDSLVRVMCEVP